MDSQKRSKKLLSGLSGLWRGKTKSVICSLLLVALALSTIPFRSLADDQPNGVRFEFEDAKVVDVEDKVISGTKVADSYSSGGFYMGNTGDKGFVFTNVPLSNRLTVAYAGTFTSFITIYLKVGDTYEELGQLGFATTQGWNMDNRWTGSSDMINIPEGSTVKLVPARDVNLDYVDFSANPWYKESEMDPNIVLAKNASVSNGSTISDPLAYTGNGVRLDANGSITATAPDVLKDQKLNVVNIRYKADQATTAVFHLNGKDVTANLPATHGIYTTTGVKVDEYQAGTTVKVSAAGILLDYIQFTYMAPSETVYIPKSIYQDGRTDISLNGTWYCDSSDFAKYKDLSETVPSDLEFDNTIPVPGLWDLAAVSMGNFNLKGMWYKRIINLEDAPTGQVVLKIDRAYYGRYIYVNGQLVGEYQYNYSNSYTTITPYLHAGENEIVVMLGGHNQQITEKGGDAHVGSDVERIYSYPGIVDNVSLIFTGDAYVVGSQTAPNVQDGTVWMRNQIMNDTEFPITTDITYKIYELGVFKDGEAQQEKKLVATMTQTGVTLAPNGKTAVDSPMITLEEFSEKKCWTPKNPFLYELEVTTSGGTFTDRFAMRTFYFDETTKLPMLNGKVYYLRGTNVAVNRFYDDPNRGYYPWTVDWVRALYQEFKSVNWECTRIHLGSAPSIWYDIADEEGFMIMDEYAWWECRCGCTAKSLTPEVHAWIDEKANHASVIIWDMQNEVLNSGATTRTIQAVRGYDIQNRPWDNGWSEAVSETDTVECHPYLHDFTFLPKAINNISTTYENPPSYIPESLGPNNPKIYNEYSNMWLNRDGDPATSSIKEYYDLAVPNGTREDRINHYATIFSQVGEFWRCGRNAAGVLHFAGLVYSKPTDQGYTGDVLMPDISDPTIHPAIKEAFRSTFAPLGISFFHWTDECELGETRDVPLVMVNDLNWDINNIKVVVRLYADDTLVQVEEKRVSLKQAGDPNGGDRYEETLKIKIPNYDASVYRLEAQYMRNGQLVKTTRSWNVTGGTASGQPKAVKNIMEEDYLDADSQTGVAVVLPPDDFEEEFNWMIVLIIAEVVIALALVAVIVFVVLKKKKA